jgi:mannose-1-phosphate guanylyltransferase/phosphomannomutase
VVATREPAAAYRLVKRAIMSGLNSAGIQVVDLRNLPAPIGKHWLNAQNHEAAFHVGASEIDPEAIQISIFERPGIAISAGLQREVEKHYSRQELRRVPFAEVGSITYPARARESYADALLGTLDVHAIRERGFRIVVDYGHSAASYVLPLVLEPLGTEAITSHPFESDAVAAQQAERAEVLERTGRLVRAVGAQLGAGFDRSGERLYLVDERGTPVALDQALLLFVRLLAWTGRGGRVAVPVTATSQVEAVAEGLEIMRTPASLPGLTQAATEEGVVFAGATGGGYVFPDFLPAYDSIASLCKLLELLARVGRPLSELVAELPQPLLVHREIQCPWALKGTVMRLLNERYANGHVDLLDGIKVFQERGWIQVLPDPDEPVVHLYAEGYTPEQTVELEQELESYLESVIEGEEIEAPAGSREPEFSS